MENKKDYTICKICQADVKNSIKLTYHIRNEHKISKEEYIILTEYNNERPKCSCGCGKYLIWNKKTKFYRFYGDHSRYVKIPKKKYNLEYLKIENRLDKNKVDISQVYQCYNDYIFFIKPMKEISEILFSDKRTIIKWWFELNLIENKDDFFEITKKHQFFWSGKNRKIIPIELQNEIYSFIKNNPNLYTIKKLKVKFGLDEHINFLYKNLCDSFGKNEIDHLVSLGNSSKPEMDLYFTLIFLFGKKNVKKQFRIDRKFYDFLLGDKILIECTYWHSSDDVKKNDKIKDDLAINNGYILIRVKEEENNNVEIITKIINLWKKIQK